MGEGVARRGAVSNRGRRFSSATSAAPQQKGPSAPASRWGPLAEAAEENHRPRFETALLLAVRALRGSRGFLVLATFSNSLVEALLPFWVTAQRRTTPRVFGTSLLLWRMNDIVVVITVVLPIVNRVQAGRIRPTFRRQGVVRRIRRSMPIRRRLESRRKPVETLVVACRSRIDGPNPRRRRSEGPH
jgi:hypothetical protein